MKLHRDGAFRKGVVTRVRFKGHSSVVTAGALSPDGRYLVTTSDDASIRIWDRRKVLPAR